MNYLLPRNWSKYSRRYHGDKEALRRYKRVILVSQFTLFGTVAGCLHAIEDLVDGLRFMPMMDSIMAASVFACYLLNENGKHHIARIVLLSFLNLFFFVYSSLAHAELGIYLYYFSWVGLAAVVFEINENFYRFFFIGLSIFLTVLLFATNFNAFGPTSFQAIDIERSFILNFISSIVVLVFFIVFMVNSNDQSEKKLVDLTIEVKQKNMDLERMNRELDRFFYGVSHDLKVPLMDIKGAIHSAMLEFDDEKALFYFEILKQRADKLDHFLQDVIDYARNSQTELGAEYVNVFQLTGAVLENFTFVKGADKIRFITEIQDDLEVEVDRVRLIMVMNNILSNSIKYHRLEQPDPWVMIQSKLDAGKLVLSIEDNGQGIEEELLPKIFNMFFRGTNQSKGSGLGLYIVKETLEKMQGTIQVVSKTGTGSRFIVSIPVKGFRNIRNTVEPKEKIPVQI
jgi:signal transduction histidine kinase